MKSGAYVDKVWCVQKSTLPIDHEFIERNHFPQEAATDPGMGLYCTSPGEHWFVFDGPPSVVMTTNKKPTKLQGYYMALVDKEAGTRVMPTPVAFKTWAIQHTFIIGHLREKYGKPTHAPDFIRGKACLRPIRRVEVGEEYSFEYGYIKPGVKDVETRR